MRATVVVALAAIVACQPSAQRTADSTTIPSIDTLKASAPGDTLPSTPAADSVATKVPGSAAKTPATTSPKLGRDSAFGPPRNLPRLDTVPTKRPPV